MSSIGSIELRIGRCTVSDYVQADESARVYDTTQGVMYHLKRYISTLPRHYFSSHDEKASYLHNVFSLASNHTDILTGEQMLQIMSAGCIISQFSLDENCSSYLLHGLCDLSVQFFKEKNHRQKFNSLYGAIDWHTNLCSAFTTPEPLERVLKVCRKNIRILHERVEKGLCTEINLLEKPSKLNNLIQKRSDLTSIHDWYALCHKLSNLIFMGSDKYIEEQVILWQQKNCATSQDMATVRAALSLLTQTGKTLFWQKMREKGEVTFAAWRHFIIPHMTLSEFVQYQQSAWHQRNVIGLSGSFWRQGSCPLSVSSEDEWVERLDEESSSQLLDSLDESSASSKEILLFFPKILCNQRVSPRLRTTIADRSLVLLKNERLTIGQVIVIGEALSNFFQGTLPLSGDTSQDQIRYVGVLFQAQWTLGDMALFEQRDIEKLMEIGKKLQVSEKSICLQLMQAFVRDTLSLLSEIKAENRSFDCIFDKITSINNCLEQLIKQIKMYSSTESISIDILLTQLPIQSFLDLLWKPGFSLEVFASPRSPKKDTRGDMNSSLQDAATLLSSIYQLLGGKLLETDVVAPSIDLLVKEIQKLVFDGGLKHLSSDKGCPRVFTKNTVMNFMSFLYKKLTISTLQHECFMKIQALCALNTLTNRADECEIVKIGKDLGVADVKNVYSTIAYPIVGLSKIKS